MSMISRLGRSPFLQKCLLKIGNALPQSTSARETTAAYHELREYSEDNGCGCIQHNQIEKAQIDLSVIVPAYNAYPHIAACIESILTQDTEYAFRLIVVNDGSTDQTSEVLKHHASDERVIVFETINGGCSAARNYALKHLCSTYVMFVDADDLLEPGAIDHLLRAAYAEDADVVEGGHFILKNDSKRIGRQCEEGTFDHALGVLTGYACMKVFKSTLFENMVFPVGYWFEDTVISMILFPQVKKTATIHDMVYSYRVNSNGICFSAKRNRKALDSFWIMVQLIKDHAHLKLPENNEYYLQLLRQIHITYHRTCWMPECMKKSIFTLSADIVDRLFPEDMLAGNWKFHALLSALRQRNYRTYHMICGMNDSLDA